MNRYFTPFMPKLVFTLVLLVISNLLIAQTTIVEWNFDNQDIYPSTFNGLNQFKTISIQGAGPTLNWYNNGDGGVSDYTIFTDNWDLGNGTKYWEIEVDLTGFDNILISSKQLSTAFGPTDFRIEYKVGLGGVWNPITGSNIVVTDVSWTGAVVDLSVPTDVDGQSSVFFRWIMTSDNSVLVPGFIDPTDKSYIDDILIKGTATSNPFVNISADGNPPASDFEKSSVNNILYRLDLAVSQSAVNVTGVTLTTQGIFDVNDFPTGGFKLWYSSDDVFNGSPVDIVLDALDPVISGNDLIFTGFSQLISINNTGYFFCTVDIGSNPTINNTIGITSTSFSNLSFDGRITIGNPTEDPAATGNLMTIIDCTDNISNVFNYTQPTADTINSLSNSSIKAKLLMRFLIRDYISCDDKETILTRIRLKSGTNNTSDWINDIQGLTLKEFPSGTPIPIVSSTINTGQIDLNINPGDLTVKNTVKIVEVLAYLNTSGLSDGDVIHFFIDRDDHGWLSDPSGSGLLSTFAADINSNNFTIGVVASELQFQTQPENTDTYVPMGVDVSVAATDVNGNIDIDHATNISLSSTGDLDATPVATPLNGIAVFNQTIPSQQIIHNTGSTNLQLTATSGSLTGTSGFFNINQTANHLSFLNVPATDQVGSVIPSFDVRALFPDDITVDLNYNGFIDIAVNTGPGSISSGTTSKQAISGVASFDDIVFDTPGNYTLIATSGTLTQDISTNIAIIGADESVFPNGLETMNVAITTPSSFSEHEAGNGFINTGVLTFSSGDVAISEADVRNTNPSDYIGASGGANVFFTSSSGDYGFAMEGIDASTYTNLTLQFAVRKENASGTAFASLVVEYYDGNNWQPISIADYPATIDGSGWKLLNPVSLPSTAEVSNLALRWIKTGDIACRIDDINLTGTPKAATNLIVATINGGLPPVVNVPFNVDIQVQDGSGSPANVLENTDIQLSLNTGTGTLGGTLTTTIFAGTNSVTISGVTYNTSEAGVIINANRLTGDNLSSGNSSPFNVLAVEPLLSASALTIDMRTTTSIDISWTNGDGSDRIVVASINPVTFAPVDGNVGYTVNPDYSAGIDLGNGDKVVYSGSGNSVNITGLQPNNTAYYFSIYEYNGADVLINYKQTDPATGSALTTCNEPSAQASSLILSNITQSSMDLSWTDGDGTGRIVLMNSINAFTDPVDGDDTHTADPSWNNTGQQVVYFANGAGSTITVTNLAPATTYYFRVYEYNCSGVDINYKTDIDNTASADTYLFSQDFTNCPPVGWLNVRIAGDQDWTCAGGYASASGLGSSSASEMWYITPAINFNLISNEKLSFDSWTSGTDDTHPKLFVMYSMDYSGSGNPYTATWDTLTFNIPTENSQSWSGSGPIDLSLINDNAAYLAFQYSSSGTSAGSATEWRIDNVQIIDEACVTPSAATSNLSFSNISQNSMTLNWTNGDGIGRLVLIKEASAVDFVPTSGEEYMASSNFLDAADPQITGGNKAVYSDGGSSVTITGLNPASTYHYAIYEFNCNSTNRTYNGSPLIGSQSTLGPDGSDIVENTGFSYPSDIDDYSLYRAPSISMSPTNSLSVFGLTLRDGGFNGTNDGLSTNLTSITFSTNGSQAIRAAAIYNGSILIGSVNVNGGTSFSIDLSSSPIVANDVDPGKTIDFELKVTFMQGDFIVDNRQIVFTVTNALAEASGSQFYQSDAGAAQSSVVPNDNTIRVIADTLIFIQRPVYSLPINELFTMEVEATDSIGTRDLDKSLTISKISGTGSLSSVTSLTKSTGDSTAVWTDLIYDTAENTEFQVSDGETTPLTITTGALIAKPRFTIFTFTGNTGSEPTAPADIDPVNVTISEVSRGTGISAANLAEAFNASSWPLTQDADSYYEITVTPNPGFQINLSSIEFDHRRSSSTTGPTNWVLENSANTSTQSDVILGDGDWDLNRNTEALLSISEENPVTFQLFAYGASNGNATWAVDNIEIFGTVTDVDPPAFTTSYPQTDSTAISGFDLVVNLTESATVYYVIQDPDVVLTAPDFNQVINGLNGDGVGAVVANSIAVASPAIDVFERVSGLLSDNVYDVYYVLYDGTYYSAVIPQTGLPTSDTNTNLVATTQPAGPYEIPSTATTADDLVNVFNFRIRDLGTADGAPTYVTQLVFNAGSNNSADWSTVIGGLILYNVTGDSYVAISNISITSNSIIVNINPGDLIIPNGITEEIEIALSIHLTGTVTDNQDLEFTIGGDPHSNTTYTIGSQFDPTLTLLTSNTYKIQVTAYRLNILSYPASIPNINQDISLEVEAVDINGNRALGEASDVVIRLGQFSQAGGEISTNPASDTLKSLGSGYAIWDNINYNITGDYITIITHSNTLIDDTTGVIQIGSPSDLIVTTTTTISSDLQVGNVDVQPTGNLTISSGVTLSVAGNFNLDGVMNGSSGTVDFNASGNNAQAITGTPISADFYNITISNSGNQGVISEIDLNLHNNLILTTGALFDADGIANDKNFTLVSTPTYTARIGQMGDGATLNGEVIWQRSLRTGPQGWRYIGTPIKNQTLANISDDVWIQGIAERYPNAWTNISTYYEPVGTAGQAGYEGWIDFTSNADNLNVGEGMKLWLWNIDYTTEQVIQMKGQPFIGNGGDGVAANGESFTLNPLYTPSAYDGGGWNFIANPYPSEINWDNVAISNLSGSAMYVWDPNDQAYKTYSSTTGPGTPDVTKDIASGQGFFVKALNNSATVTFSEASKSSDNNNSFFRIGEDIMQKLMVQVIAENGRKDETAVAFTSFAENEYDPEYDALKLSGGYVNLSSIVEEKQIAINAMGVKRGVQSVKLNIDPYVYGNYTMKFPQIKDFSDEAIIRLVDKYLDKTKYINSASTYVFNIDENNPDTYGADRFEIQFVEPANFKFSKPTAKAGQEFVVPVFADKLEDVINTNMAIGWDKDALTFVSIEDSGIGDISSFDLTQAANGKLIFSDDQIGPVSLPDGTQLFSIRFKANNGTPQAQLRFEKAYMSLKAINDIDMPFSSEDVLIDILQNKFVSGAVTTYSGELVNGVKITAQNTSETIEKISDLDGSYSLDTYQQSEYNVSALKSDDVPLMDAVTTLDIIKTRSHILNKEKFVSPYQWIAADVNGSNTITAIDLVEMRKVILGINPTFQSGLDWLIIPDTYNLSNNPFNYQTNVNVTLADLDIDLDFIGVKVGDVDNSWSNSGALRRSNLDFALNMDNIHLQDDLVEIPIVVTNLSDIRGYQFTITWDPNELQYYGSSSEILEGFYNDQMADQGILTTLWDQLQGDVTELKEGEILMTLQFRTLNENAISEVAINSAVTPAVAFDGQLNAMAISSSPAVVNLEELRNGSMELFQNVPNPFDFTTEIGFKLPKSGLVRLSIVNTLGEIIYLHEDNYTAGIYNISWDRNQGMRSVSPGVYLYRLESNGEEVVKKMVIK